MESSGQVRLRNAECRNLILTYGFDVGVMCLHLQHPNEAIDKVALEKRATSMWDTTLEMAESMLLDVGKCITVKLRKNADEYPVDQRKGVHEDEKYTVYSKSSRVRNDDRATVILHDIRSPVLVDGYAQQQAVGNFHLWSNAVKEFGDARQWMDGYTIRNLVFSLLGEVGKLSGLWKFRSDETIGCWLESDVVEVAMKLADIAIYLIHLFRVLAITPYED